MRPILVVAAFLLIVAAAPAQTVTPSKHDLSSVRRDVQRDVDGGAVPGLTVAVAENGKILWQEGFGWANLERRIRATENTAFYIASVTKSITATAIVQLQERDKLRIDDPVNDYLRFAKVHSPMWNAADATIRRVLSHTGGLTTFTRWCLTVDPRCDIDEEIKRYGILVWPPGEVFDYSNLGYGILGRVVEQSSGLSLDSYLKKEFFGPLDMGHCTFDPASPQTAVQYDEKSHRPSPPKVSGHPGASGLRCSAHDLLRFGRLHLNESVSARPILSAADIDEMHSPQANTHAQYGLGWWIKQHAKYQVVYAEGGTTDSYALVELVPARDLAVVVIANSYAKSVNDLGDKIVSALIPDFGVVETSANNTAANAGSGGLRALAGDWKGQILADRGAVDLSVKVGEDGSVLAQIGDGPRTLMTDVSVKPRHLYGRMPGSPLIGEGPNHQPVLELDLALRGAELIGAATAGPKAGEDGDQLPYWVKLSRVQP